MHHQKDILASNKNQAEVEVEFMGDFWASTVDSSKYFSAQPNSGNRMVLDNLGVIDHDDDSRTYYNCPFCYVDVEVCLLCDHLQEEHCYDVKNSVCPVCAMSLGKDVAGHFKVHHASSIKTQKRSQKSGFWSFYAGRNLNGSLCAKNGMDIVNGSAPDPLLSPFLFSTSYSESKSDGLHELSSNNDVSSISATESSTPSALNQSKLKGNSEELRQRAAFCQQLMYSTIL